jgi:hypothetical protein
VDAAWLAAPGGIAVRGLPTWHGTMDLTMKTGPGGSLVVELGGKLRLPRGGFVVRPPHTRAIRSLTVNGASVKTFSEHEAVIHAFPARCLITFSANPDIP